MKLAVLREFVNRANYLKWIDDCRKIHPEAQVVGDEHSGAKMMFTTGSISHLVGIWDYRGGKGVVYGAYKRPDQRNDTLEDID